MSASKKKILSSEQLRFLDIAFHGTFSDEASLQKDWSDDMYERLVKATRRCKAVVQEWLEERKAEYAQELKKTAATTSIAATTDVRVIEETPRKVTTKNGRSSRSPDKEKSKSLTASTSKKRAYINLNADDRESSEDEQEPKNMNEPVANLDKSMFVEPQHSSSTASSSSGSSTELEIKKPPTPPNSRISSDAFVQTNASLNGTFAVPSGVPPKLFGPPQKRLRHLILAIEPSQEYVLQFVQPFLVYDTL